MQQKAPKLVIKHEMQQMRRPILTVRPEHPTFVYLCTFSWHHLQPLWWRHHCRQSSLRQPLDRWFQSEVQQLVDGDFWEYRHVAAATGGAQSGPLFRLTAIRDSQKISATRCISGGSAYLQQRKFQRDTAQSTAWRFVGLQHSAHKPCSNVCWSRLWNKSW